MIQKRLKLSKETLKTLSEKDLTLVAGGQSLPLFGNESMACNGS